MSEEATEVVAEPVEKPVKLSKAESLAKARAAKAANAEQTKLASNPAQPAAARKVDVAPAEITHNKPAPVVVEEEEDPEQYGPELIQPWHGCKERPSGYCTCGKTMARSKHSKTGDWSCIRILTNDEPTSACQKGLPSSKFRTEAPPPRKDYDDDE